MASVSRSRLLQLTKVQSTIFAQTFNPSQLRLGTKVLHQRLRGRTLAAYYPRRSATVGDLLKGFKRFGLEGWDEEQLDREEKVAVAKIRGKGAPKKIRTKEGGRSMKKKGGKR
ncbi:hypothetical protein DV736_g6083, partial [Chaetothyriales sp. CBS 134916]